MRRPAPPHRRRARALAAPPAPRPAPTLDAARWSLPGDAGAAGARTRGLDRRRPPRRRAPTRSPPATARGASAPAPTSSRAAARASSPRRCAPRACSSTPSPNRLARARCRPRRPTRSTPAPPGAPRSSTPASSRRRSPRRARCSRSSTPPPTSTTPSSQGGHLPTLGGFPLSSAHGTETAAVAARAQERPRHPRRLAGHARAQRLRCRTRSACANSVAGIARAIEQGAVGDQHELRRDRALLRRVRPAAGRDRQGDHARRRRRQRAGRGQPAAVPRLPPPRDHRRGGRQRPQGRRSSRARAPRSTCRRRASASSPRRRRSSTRTATADGYEAVTGTSFSAPMVAAAAAWLRAAKPGYRADQVAQALRGSARDLQAQGLGLGHRLRDARPAARAQRARARRSTRTSPTTTWRGSTARRPATSTAPIWRRGGPAPRARARRQVRGPGRRLPDRLPPARARARDPEAALRQPRPRRLHPHRDLDGRRRADHRPLPPQGQEARHADAAQPVAGASAPRTWSSTSTRSTRTLDSRYELRVQRAEATEPQLVWWTSCSP